MPVDASKRARAVRAVVYSFIFVLAVSWFYFYYRELIERRRQTYLNSAVTSLEVTSDVLGSKLSSWRKVVKNAAGSGKDPKQYADYINYMVPGLDPVDDPTDAQCGASAIAAQSGSAKPAATATAAPVDPSISPPHVEIFLQPGQRTLQFKYVTGIADGTNRCAISIQDLLPSLFRELPEDLFEDILVASDSGVVYYQFAGIGPRISNMEGLLANMGPSAPDANPLSAWFAGLFTKRDAASGSTADFADTLRDAIARANRRKVKDAASFSDLLKFQLAGEEYLSVLQPVTLDAKVWSSAGIKSEEERKNEGTADQLNLVLIGLIRGRQFDAATSAWPSGVVAWIGLFLVLVYSLIFSLSSLPMKAKLQPVHRRNIAWMLFCGLTGCAGLTLAVTHGYFLLFESDREIRQALEALGTKIDENVQEELCQFYHVLEGMTNSRKFKDALADYSSVGSDRKSVDLTNLLSKDSLTKDREISAIGYSYPFFDQVSWSDSDRGGQIAKWSIHRDVTPVATMTQFPWFLEARDPSRLFHLRASNPAQDRLLNSWTQDVYVEPLVSPNTGEYLTVLMKPSAPHAANQTSPRTPYVGFLIAPLLSVNSPVFPPGYGFAVIRSDGTVLFSSSPDRNMRENFFRECEWNDKLIEASHAHRSQTLTVAYAGREVLLHVRPLEALIKADWTILTYREQADDQRAAVDTFTQTMQLMLPHGLIMLILALVFRSLVALPGARQLWPHPERGGDYLRLVCMLLTVFVFTSILALDTSRTLVFVEVLILSPFAIVLAASFLVGRKHVAFLTACVYPAVALANAFKQAADGRFGSRGAWVDVALVVLGLIVCAFVIGFDDLPQFQPLKTRLRMLASRALSFLNGHFHRVIDPRNGALDHNARFQVDVDEKRVPRWTVWVYTFAVCIGIMLLSVLPTIACYRIAFQMIHTAHAMEDLIKVKRALEKRTHAVRSYYSDIVLSDVSDEKASLVADHGGIDLADLPNEKSRFVTDRLSLENDRYDLALPSLALSRVEFPQDEGKPPLIDVKTVNIPFLHIVTPAYLWESARKSTGMGRFRDQFFLLCRLPFVQFSYRDDAKGSAVSSNLNTGDPSIWGYRSLAVTIPDLNPSGTVLWASTAILLFLIFFGVKWLVNLLFFIKFKSPDIFEPMALADLKSVKTNVLLLCIAGSLDGSDSDELKNIQDSRKLENVKFVDGTPVLLRNFDLCWDTEELAAAKLAFLEDLLFSSKGPVVLIASIDPVDYIAEVISSGGGQGSNLSDFFVKTEQRWNRVFLCFERRRMSPGVPKIIAEQNETPRHLARRIYTSCTDSQRAVLYQIAESGWVNPNNVRAISTLMARGWIELVPMPVLSGELKLIGDHPKKLISELASPEEIQRWDAARTGLTTVLTIGGLILAAVLLIAGKDIFQSIPAMITGLLTVTPLAWKTFSQFGKRASVEIPKETEDV
jgi:hypothetical protein